MLNQLTHPGAPRCRIYELRVCVRSQGLQLLLRASHFMALWNSHCPSGQVQGSPRSALCVLLPGASCEPRGLYCLPPTAYLQTVWVWDKRELGAQEAATYDEEPQGAW